MEEEKLAPAAWRIAGVALLGPLLSSLDATVVNVALETVRRDLGTSLTTIQWVTSAYLLSLALVLPLSGWLVDRVGAKRVYLGCFAVFTLTSLACGAATSAAMLIAFRVLQGISGGLLAPMAQMMAARVAGRQVARMMAIIATPVMIGPILGPSVASFLVAHASWRWVFFINLPIGIGAVIAAWLVLPADRDELEPRRFDLPGFVLLSPALVFLVHGLERLGTQPSLGSCLELGAGVVLLLAFVGHALRRGSAALVDVLLFRKATFRASALTQFFANAVIFGGGMIAPLYLVLGTDVGPGRAGVLLGLTGVGMLVAYPVVGRLTNRLGPRRTSAGGAAIALVFTLPFALFPVLPVPVMALALFARGFGMGSINIPSIAAAYTGLPKREIPVATTAINIVQRLGGPVATTLLALALQRSGGFLWTMRALCTFHVVSVIAALGLPRVIAPPGSSSTRSPTGP